MEATGSAALVIDSCVAVKWFANEPDADRARYLASPRRILIAPDIFTAELGSALLKKVRQGEFEPDAVAPAIASTDLLVSLVPSPELASAAFEVAHRYGRSFYDALYVALAVREGYRLVTADDKLIAAIGRDFGGTVLSLSAVDQTV